MHVEPSFLNMILATRSHRLFPPTSSRGDARVNAAEDEGVSCERVLLLKRLVVPDVCEGV